MAGKVKLLKGKAQHHVKDRKGRHAANALIKFEIFLVFNAQFHSHNQKPPCKDSMMRAVKRYQRG